MRLSPVAIRWHRDLAKATEAAQGQSVTTHGAPAAVDACVFFATLLVEAIQGNSRATVLRPRRLESDQDVAAIAAGSRVTKDRKRVVEGKSVSVRVDLCGRRFIKK